MENRAGKKSKKPGHSKFSASFSAAINLECRGSPVRTQGQADYSSKRRSPRECFYVGAFSSLGACHLYALHAGHKPSDMGRTIVPQFGQLATG